MSRSTILHSPSSIFHFPFSILRVLYLVLFAAMPWGVEPELYLGWRMVWPTEPLLILIGLCLTWGLVTEHQVRNALIRDITGHKLIWFSLVWAAWPAATAVFGAFPIISLKYSIITWIHLWVFLIGGLIFPTQVLRWLKVYSGSFLLLVVFVLFQHGWLYQWRTNQVELAPLPFFENHTGYAAMLVWVMAIVWFYWQYTTGAWSSLWGRYRHWWFGGAMLLLLVALAISTCRAAWLSVVGAGGILWFYKRLPKSVSMTGFVLLLIVYVVGTFYRSHRQAAQDVSTAERLNRYASAIRMAAERPVAGWGAGAYQYTYIPFQKPEEMTRLSLNKPFYYRSLDTMGRGGGAHSEFFRALSETGWTGFLLLLAWLAMVFGAGLPMLAESKTAVYLLPLLSGFLAYWLHGVFNEYFHDARFAAMNWLFVVILVKKQHAVHLSSPIS